VLRGKHPSSCWFMCTTEPPLHTASSAFCCCRFVRRRLLEASAMRITPKRRPPKQPRSTHWPPASINQTTDRLMYACIVLVAAWIDRGGLWPIVKSPPSHHRILLTSIAYTPPKHQHTHTHTHTQSTQRPAPTRRSSSSSSSSRTSSRSRRCAPLSPSSWRASPPTFGGPCHHPLPQRQQP
jgi:hypothetical protein